MARRRSESLLVTVYEDGALRRRPDDVIVEEPMTIQLDGNIVSTTMRTPGNDYELAAGFCFSDGLLGGARGEGRAILRGRCRQREPVQCRHGRDRWEGPGADATTRHHHQQLRVVRQRLHRGAVRSSRTASDHSADRPRRAHRECRRRRSPVRACSRPPAPCMPLRRSPPSGEVLIDPRGRRPPQRSRQGGRSHAARRPTSGHRSWSVRQRAGQLRAGAEGLGSRIRHA